MKLPRSHDLLERLHHPDTFRAYFRIFDSISERPSIFAEMAEEDDPNKDEPTSDSGSPLLKKFLECTFPEVFYRDHVILMAILVDAVEIMTAVALGDDVTSRERKRFVDDVIIPHMQWLKAIWSDLFKPLLHAIYVSIDKRRKYASLVANCAKSIPKSWKFFERMVKEEALWKDSLEELRFLFSMRNISEDVIVDIFSRDSRVRPSEIEMREWEANVVKKKYYKRYYMVFVDENTEDPLISKMRLEFRRTVPDFLAHRLGFRKIENNTFLDHTPIGRNFKEKVMSLPGHQKNEALVEAGKESTNHESDAAPEDVSVNLAPVFEECQTREAQAKTSDFCGVDVAQPAATLRDIKVRQEVSPKDRGGPMRVTKTYQTLKESEMCIQCEMCPQVYAFRMDSNMYDNRKTTTIREIYNKIEFSVENRRVVDNHWHPMACFKKVNAFRQMKKHYKKSHGRWKERDIPPLFRKGNSRTAARAASKNVLKIYESRDKSNYLDDGTDSE